MGYEFTKKLSDYENRYLQFREKEGHSTMLVSPILKDGEMEGLLFLVLGL